MQAGLVVGQVATAAVVLIGTGLLLRSYERLGSVDVGFATEDRTTFRVAPSWTAIPERAEAIVACERLLAAVGALPGVEEVAAVNRLPLSGGWWTTRYLPEGAAMEARGEPSVLLRVASPGYFRVMGIDLLQGRDLAAGDDAAALPVVVVSESLAREAWPGETGIGRRLKLDPDHPDAPYYTVVGVVSDVRSAGLDQPPDPIAYVSLPQARFGHFADWGMDVVVHSASGDPPSLPMIQAAVAEVLPGVPVFAMRPLSGVVREELARRRVTLVLLGGFGGTALLLALLGLYGLLAYTVGLRRVELGVRAALGATPRRLRGAVIARGTALAAAGAVVGLVLAAALSRFLSGFLYGVSSLDPITFVAVGAGLVVLACLAAALPAHHAARSNPMEMLRAE